MKKVCFCALNQLIQFFKYIEIYFNKSHTFSPQLQTIFEALENLAFSGAVKSTYPKTFLELNQVSIKILIIYSNWEKVCIWPFFSV